MNSEQNTNEDEGGGSALNVQLCGCGRAVRYMMPNGKSSCNKHVRCLTYEEQNNALIELNRLVMAYRAKREVDGLNGRAWDASKHFHAESVIEALEMAYNAIITGRSEC